MLRKGSKSFYEWCIENNKEEYLELWDYEMNLKNPEDVSFSYGEYYFKCSQNKEHKSYIVKIRSLTVSNSGGLKCPICNSIFQWCLDNNRQDIIDAWDYDRNLIPMNSVSRKSGKKYWFKFDNYSYLYPICYINNKTDPVKKYKNSLGYYLLLNYGENGINIFWSSKNNDSPFDYDRCSRKEVWFKCNIKNYHEDYKTACYSFTSNIRCPSCASKIIHPLDSFAQYNINRYGESWLENNWCKDNTVDPFKLAMYNNDIKVHIKCLDVDYHDFWIIPSNYSSRDDICPYCNIKGSRSKVHYLDSLGSKHNEILNIWSDKNMKSPYEYSEYSHEKIFLKCENNIHDDYSIIVSKYSTEKIHGCPLCKSHNISSYELLTRKYIESLPYTILYEYNCTILPINPKTNYPLPFDNEIKELRLIIEVMGKQHYEMSGFNTLNAIHNNSTPEEEYIYSKWKDNYKKQYALDHGYFYLELLYTYFDDNTYINCINNKINEILKLESVTTAGFLQ